MATRVASAGSTCAPPSPRTRAIALRQGQASEKCERGGRPHKSITQRVT